MQAILNGSRTRFTSNLQYQFNLESDYDKVVVVVNRIFSFDNVTVLWFNQRAFLDCRVATFFYYNHITTTVFNFSEISIGINLTICNLNFENLCQCDCHLSVFER